MEVLLHLVQEGEVLQSRASTWHAWRDQVAEMIRPDPELRRLVSEAWRRLAGRPVVDEQADLASLRRTEWSPAFERLMRNRLLMGAFRYGRMGTPGKPVYDRISDIVRRVEQYKKTGNDELLVDAANLCLLEFVEGVHPQKHFEGTDDGVHTRAL